MAQAQETAVAQVAETIRLGIKNGTFQAGEKLPPQYAGLKFFNVFGPNELHKGAMQSVLTKVWPDIAAGRSRRSQAASKPPNNANAPAANKAMETLDIPPPLWAWATRRHPAR